MNMNWARNAGSWAGNRAMGLGRRLASPLATYAKSAAMNPSRGYAYGWGAGAASAFGATYATNNRSRNRLGKSFNAGMYGGGAGIGLAFAIRRGLIR